MGGMTTVSAMADPTAPNPTVPQDPSTPPPAPPPAPSVPTSPTVPTSPAEPTPPTPPTKPRLSLRSPLVAGIAGLVVGAVVVGVPWLIVSGNTSALGADRTSLKAPVSIGAYTQLQKNSKLTPASLKMINDSDPQSAKNLSAAYGGAAAVVQRYSDADLANFVTLEAVRAQSPTPYVPYESAQDLGLAKPDQEIETFGAVHCLVANTPTQAGQLPQEASANTVTCERTSAHLTVRLRFGGGGDLMHTPQQAADLANWAWGLLS